MILFVVVGAVIVLALAVIAGYLHWQLYKVNRASCRAREGYQRELQKKRRHSLTSITVIARALLEGQVTLTEACMRISVLLESLNLSVEEKDHYVSFYKLAQATSYIPILDDWKALPRKDKRRLDVEREAHEAEYRDFVISAAQRIVSKKKDYEDHIETLTS